MKLRIRAALAALAFGACAAPVLAADLPSRKDDVVPAPLPAMVTYDPFQIRLRVVDVAPTASNNSVYTFGGAFVGKGLTVGAQVIPELDLSYYFTPNIAVEAICCFSYHEIKAVNALSALGKVGNTWVFPPTLLLQYHFTNSAPSSPMSASA